MEDEQLAIPRSIGLHLAIHKNSPRNQIATALEAFSQHQSPTGGIQPSLGVDDTNMARLHPPVGPSLSTNPPCNKEVNENTVAVRTREGKDIGAMSIDVFAEHLRTDIAQKQP